jgi:hypothetical protein
MSKSGTVSTQTGRSLRGIVERSGWWVITPTRVGTRARVYRREAAEAAVTGNASTYDLTASVRSVRPRIDLAITRRWISLVPS